MRKLLLPILTVLVLALAGGGAWLYMQLERSQGDVATLQNEENQTRTRYSHAIDEIAAIQDSLSAIMLGGDGQLLDSDLTSEQKLSETRGDATLARISVVKAGIDRAKTRILELDRQLAKSGVRAAGLERMVASLKKNVSEKETQVTALTQAVAQLETRVTGLVAEVETNHGVIEARDQALEARRSELGTVFYAIGNKKRLTDSGVAIAKGGVLGLGRTLEATGRIDSDLFTPLDTDHQTEIRIPSARAQVVSDQPAASYELQVLPGETVLRILDPAQFRTVKHVVIVTT